VQETPSSRATSSRFEPLVLVVEDDVDTCAFYAATLQANGFRTTEAGDGRMGLDKAFAFHPALVLTDLAIPLLDGWELVRCLKADFRTQAIPVVVVSGCVREIDKARAVDAGCDAFLGKPCEISLLVSTVRSFIEQRADNIPNET
jgi:DNA-binding response OmpR family regulator